MIEHSDLDRRLRGALTDAAPAREPDGLFDAVMSASLSVRQRPRFLVGPPTSSLPGVRRGHRLALVAITVVLTVATVGAAVLSGVGSRQPGIVLSSPTPSASSRSDLTVAIQPGESWILYERFTQLGGGLFLMRPDGTDEHQILTALGGRLHQSDWSPDGDRVVFMDEFTDWMWIANLDGSDPRQVETCNTGGCGNPAWSPDGTKIAFSRVENGAAVGPSAAGVYVLDLASGNVTTVIRLARPLLADVPRWSPDGTQLVIGVDQMDDGANETGAAIAVVPATGGTQKYLTRFADFAYSPDWSPVSNTIVFAPQVKPEPTTGGPGTWDLFTINADGSRLRQVTHVTTGVHLWGGAWSRDGTRILAGIQDQRTGVFVDPVSGTVAPIGGTDFAFGRLRPIP